MLYDDRCHVGRSHVGRSAWRLIAESLLGPNKERRMDQETLGFPLWLRINHFINLFCIFLLMRSGLQILSDHPKLYWNDHATPGSEWIKFGKKAMPRDRLCDLPGEIWSRLNVRLDRNRGGQHHAQEAVYPRRDHSTSAHGGAGDGQRARRARGLSEARDHRAKCGNSSSTANCSTR